MPSEPRTPDIPQEKWDEYRAEITAMYEHQTGKQIIAYLGEKYKFYPSLDQLRTQLRTRWKVLKNFTSQAQVNAYTQVQGRGGRPTEVLIENRSISVKKIKKTATAVATAQRRKAAENTYPEPTSKRRKRDDVAVVQEQVSLDNIIVRTPPALKEVPTASPVPSLSTLIQDYESQTPIDAFTSWFEITIVCLANVISMPSFDTHNLPEFGSQWQLYNSGDLQLTFWHNMHNIANHAAESYLHNIIVDLPQEGYIERQITIPSNIPSKFAALFRLLHCMACLGSNNLLPKLALSNILEWISNEGLVWIFEFLIDSQLPTMAIFANLLFNGAVDMGNVYAVTSLLAQGVDVNLIAKQHFDVTVGRSYRRISPLQVAIDNADAAMVRTLLESGAKVNNATIANTSAGRFPIRTDLDLASQGPRLCFTTIQLLLHEKANPNVPIPEYDGFTSVPNRVLELQDMEVVKELLSAGALVDDHQHGQSLTALQTGAKYCHGGETVKELIDAGADVNLPSGPEYDIARNIAKKQVNRDFFITPLQHAAQRDDLAMAKVLLDNHADVDGFDFDDFFPLGYYNKTTCYCSDSGSDSDSDCDCDSKAYGEYLDEAEYYPDDDIGSFKQQPSLYSPLQAAAANKSLVMTHLLLEHHATIDMMGGLGTALQIACMEPGNMEIVKLLIDKGADINSPAHCRYGQTALQAAILAGDVQVAEYLLDNGADIHTPASWLSGRTALQAATKMGYFHLANRLIELGANVNEETSMHQETCLHFAARSGNMELVSLLLEHGADIDPFPTAVSQSTVLFEAIHSGQHRIVEKILEYGADPSREDEEHIEYGYVGAAIDYCNRETVEMLLKRGADPIKTYFDKSTPLHYAIRNGSSDLVPLLLSLGGDPNKNDSWGWSAFTRAIEAQDENLIRVLIDSGAHVNPPYGHCVKLPLAAAVCTGNIDIIHILLAAGADIHGLAGIRGLVEAIDANMTDAVELLLSLGLRATDINMGEYYDKYYGGHSKMFPLARAIEKENHAVVDMLLAQDTGFYSRDGDALRQAVRSGDLQLIRRLLKLRLTVSAQKFYTEALEEAVLKTQVDIADVLITAGADINGLSRILGVGTIFNEAITIGSLAMVRLFIQRGAHINPSLTNRDAQFTPLQCAARDGTATIVDLLLIHGADVNAPAVRQDGRTALDAAAANGRLDNVYKMLKYDKEPQTLGERIKEAAGLARWNGFPLVADNLEKWQQK